MSFKEYKEHLAKIEQNKKAEAERRKNAEEALKSSLGAAYGSSSSSEEETEADIKEENLETKETTNNLFKVPSFPNNSENFPSSDPGNSLTTDSPDLPPDFIDKPVLPNKPSVKAGEKRKSSAEFGSSDFWSTITKKIDF